MAEPYSRYEGLDEDEIWKLPSIALNLVCFLLPSLAVFAYFAILAPLEESRWPFVDLLGHPLVLVAQLVFIFLGAVGFATSTSASLRKRGAARYTLGGCTFTTFGTFALIVFALSQFKGCC